MSRDLLLQVLREPERARACTPAEWNVLIPQARVSNLSARLADALAHLDGILPPRVGDHLKAAQTVAARQQVAVLAEAQRVKRALDEAGIRLILLKGAAYLAADLPAARGRVFGDIDLLVARTAVPETESVLLRHGWINSHLDAYDQRYYRQWMHEIPPLRHVVRDTVLDVHHNILPLSARRVPDARLLLDAAVPAAALPGAWVLAPADMVLHSACHLFHEGELNNGLRDLMDLDRLLRHFGEAPGFFGQLQSRAADLGLEEPLGYACSLCAALLGTPVPPHETAWGDLFGPLLHAAYQQALRPDHASADGPGTTAARYFLYVRAHWLRMRPYQLTAHLSRKAWRRWSGLGDAEDRNKKDAQEAVEREKAAARRRAAGA